ncbi:MAG TPA: nuclear transport factor 2 family protein [Pyrinomonadaceae bacterium]|nr:nuclear transport factor 2 family protein [Pyrinomonadaceae bacterium]
MEERGGVNASGGKVPRDVEATLAAPRFDEKSVQRAQPAVPLAARAGVPASSTGMIVVCLVAALVGAVVGVIALTLYQRDSRVASDGEPPRAAGLASAGAQGAAETPRAEAPAGEGASAPAGGAAAEPEAAETLKAAGEGSSGGGPAAAEGGAGDVTAPPREDEAALRGALGEWVAATNARDIARQMDFYDQRLGSFYLTRNVTREAVRAEKSRVFASASAVDVRAAEPDIRLSPDGRTAVMRFRKQYRIEGGSGARRGEVLQELRWRRTPRGWKIVGERDLRVLQ